MKQRLVEVASFDIWAEAELYRKRLAACKIPAVIAGPNTSGTFGMYFGRFSKVSVLVPAKAARLIEEKGVGRETPSKSRKPRACHSRQPKTPIRVRRKQNPDQDD